VVEVDDRPPIVSYHDERRGSSVEEVIKVAVGYVENSASVISRSIKVRDRLVVVVEPQFIREQVHAEDDKHEYE